MTETRRRGWHTVKVRREGQSSLFNLPPPICLPLHSLWARVTRFPVHCSYIRDMPKKKKTSNPVAITCRKCQVLVYISSKNTKRLCHGLWAHVSLEIIPLIWSERVLGSHCPRLHVMPLIRQRFKIKQKNMLPSWKACFYKRKSWLTGNKHTYFLILFLKV